MSAERYLPRFFVHQKIAMTTNRYSIVAANPDGSEGELLGVAQQKRLAFKEQVTFFADEGRTRPVFGFRARQRVDLGATYDVTDAAGTPLATFRKDFRASLLRSTFHLEGPGFRGTGQERNLVVAILRRFTEIPFLPVHFDFVADSGQPILSIERQVSVRDRYTVTVHDPDIDVRVAAAVAVATDVLMSR